MTSIVVSMKYNDIAFSGSRGERAGRSNKVPPLMRPTTRSRTIARSIPHKLIRLIQRKNLFSVGEI